MLLSDAIWIITLTMILIKTINDIIEYAKGKLNEGAWYLYISIFILILAGLGLFGHVRSIHKYEKEPKVLTTNLPSVDTLELEGKTYYLYMFDDNHYDNKTKRLWEK